VSSKNALRHGLLSHSPVLPDEDPQAYAELRARWLDRLRPEGDEETFLAERLVTVAWRLRRMERAEAGILAWRMQMEREIAAGERVRAQERNLLPIADEFTTIVDAAAHRAALDDLAALASSRQREDVLLGLAFMREATESEALGKLARYEGALERSFYRTADRLRCLQETRRAEPCDQRGDDTQPFGDTVPGGAVKGR
jgi:hypothetical protein